MTTFSPINPTHYLVNPPGIGLECIEYIRKLPHCQATGGKYLYRLGNKDSFKQDLDKSKWYLEDAIKHAMIDDLRILDPEILKTIECVTLRSTIFYHTVIGDLESALKLFDSALEYKNELDPLDLTSRLKSDSL